MYVSIGENECGSCIQKRFHLWKTLKPLRYFAVITVHLEYTNSSFSPLET